MRNITYSLLLSGALAFPALAQDMMPGGNSLPELPPASELTADDIGKHFEITKSGPDGEIKEDVFFIGVSPEGRSLAFSLSDTPEHRQTFADTLQYCAAKGDYWKMPTLNELKMLSPFVNEPTVDYIPGSYWSSTPAPCFDCNHPNLFKMAYDVRSGNFRNNYDSPIFKNYPLCAYDIP